MSLVIGVMIAILGGLWGLFSSVPYMQTPNNGSILKNWPELHTTKICIKSLG